jgi:hypothetical protein
MTTGLANINVKGAVAMVSFASMCLNSTLLHPGEEKLATSTILSLFDIHYLASRQITYCHSGLAKLP